MFSDWQKKLVAHNYITHNYLEEYSYFSLWTTLLAAKILTDFLFLGTAFHPFICIEK